MLRDSRLLTHSGTSWWGIIQTYQGDTWDNASLVQGNRQHMIPTTGVRGWWYRGRGRGWSRGGGLLDLRTQATPTKMKEGHVTYINHVIRIGTWWEKKITRKISGSGNLQQHKRSFKTSMHTLESSFHRAVYRHDMRDAFYEGKCFRRHVRRDTLPYCLI